MSTFMEQVERLRREKRRRFKSRLKGNNTLAEHRYSLPPKHKKRGRAREI